MPENKPFKDEGVKGHWTGCSIVRDQPDEVTVDGRCPRCSHKTRYVFGIYWPDGGTPDDAAAPADLESYEVDRDARHVVECDCGKPHKGRPDPPPGGKGCGAAWYGRARDGERS